MIRAAVQTQRVTVFKDLFEDQGSLSWSSFLTTPITTPSKTFPIPSVYRKALSVFKYYKEESSVFAPCTRIKKCPCA